MLILENRSESRGSGHRGDRSVAARGTTDRRRRGGDGGLSGLDAGGLGDIGIPAVDAVIAQTQGKIDHLVLATEIGAVCSVIGAVAGLILLFGGRR